MGKVGVRKDAGQPCGYVDEDGLETTPAWDCPPSCAVRRLDEQAGPRWNGGNTGNAKTAGTNSIFGGGKGLGADGVVHPHGYTTASRFFPQFQDDHELDAWLLRLIRGSS